MGELTSDQLARQEVENQNIQAGIEFVNATATRLGYRIIYDLDSLGLTESQIKQIGYIGSLFIQPDQPDRVRLLEAVRKDGLLAKAIVISRPDQTFTADIFSPADYQGHAGNHDYTQSELYDCLKQAQDGPTHQSLKTNH